MINHNIWSLMHILLLSQFFSTTKGGGEYVFKIIANSLAQNENKVWVITNKIKKESYQETENLKIITVKPEMEYQGGLPPSFSDNFRYIINASWKGRALVKKEKIDLIHSNNFSPAVAGAMISYFTKVPHIVTIHDIFSLNDKSFWKKWAAQSGVSYTNARLVPFFEKIIMQLRADCIHTVSETSKKDIQSMGTKKTIHVIPNCIQGSKQLNVKPKKDQFVYIGRLVFYKNLEVVLQALKIVTKQFPNTKLIIAGDGPHRKTLENLVSNLQLQNNVTFTGYITPTEKEKLLAESNALLFPSTTEGFGLVILESFQQGRPVLVSNIPPVSEIIEDGKTGLVIESSNEQSWAQNIIRLIQEPTLADKMGKAGYKVLREKYNQELFFKNIVNMYESVLGN